MAITDVFKKIKEEKQKKEQQENKHNCLVEIRNNPTLKFQIYFNNEPLAESLAVKYSKDKKSVLKVLDSYKEKKWWLSTKPEELALQQFKLGKDLPVIDDYTLANCVKYITGKDMLVYQIRENWDDLYNEIVEIIGEDKVKDLTYTEEDWERELEEICKIDLR